MANVHRRIIATGLKCTVCLLGLLLIAPPAFSRPKGKRGRASTRKHKSKRARPARAGKRPSSAKASKQARIYHCSRKGETPTDIARIYGVSVASLDGSSSTIRRLLEDNKRRSALRKKHRRRARKWPPRKLRPNQRIRVFSPKRAPIERDAVLRLSRGASLHWVAKRWHTSVPLLRCLNGLPSSVHTVRSKQHRPRRKRPAGIAYHDWLWVRLPTPAHTARALGGPSTGRLVHGERLPEAPHLIVRTPRNAFGTHHTITQILRATGRVVRAIANTPSIVVGDLSKRGGGLLPPHKSHQNGLDADIGYYHVVKVRKDRFTRATARNLDRRRSWAFIRALLDGHETQYIFVGTPIQKLLYQHIMKNRRQFERWCLRWMATRQRRGAKKTRKRGSAATRCMETVMEYPRSRGSTQAIVRHARSHINHLHVRFFPRHGKRHYGDPP